jgi:hypothetical protein
VSGDPLAALRRIAAVLPPRERRQIERVAATIAATRDPAARERVAAAVGVVTPALAGVMPSCAVLAPAYPRAPREIQARLALGEAPAEILSGLTRREAHEALSAGCADPVSWVLRDYPAVRARDVTAARWAVACLADPARSEALYREREHFIADARVRGRLLDRIDEIRAADLPRGPATGVEVAFESAARRAYEEWQARAATQTRPLAPAPSWWRPARCARLLLSAADLAAEGREMAHCVGTYAGAVEARQVVIVSIAIRVGSTVARSTVELGRGTAVVRQHRGQANRDPHPLCVRAVEVLERRWRRAAGGAP